MSYNDEDFYEYHPKTKKIVAEHGFNSGTGRLLRKKLGDPANGVSHYGKTYPSPFREGHRIATGSTLTHAKPGQEHHGLTIESYIAEISTELKRSYGSKAMKQYSDAFVASKKTDDENKKSVLQKVMQKRGKGIGRIMQTSKVLESNELQEGSLGANMKLRDVHQHLKDTGWKLHRSSGGHDIFKHDKAKEHIAVPRHKKISPGVMGDILKKSTKLIGEDVMKRFNTFIKEGFSSEKEAAKDLVKMHGKNIKKSHIDDYESNSDADARKEMDRGALAKHIKELGGRLAEAQAHPPVKHNELHVSDAGKGKYKVHAVGKKFASGIKVGEHLTDTHLDDFTEMGGKITMMKKAMKESVDEAVKARPTDAALYKALGPTKNYQQGVEALKKAHGFTSAQAKGHINRLMNQIAKDDKTQKEEVEQVDELRVSTLTRYGTKAMQSFNKDPSKNDKRILGMARAQSRIRAWAAGARKKDGDK